MCCQGEYGTGLLTTDLQTFSRTVAALPTGYSWSILALVLGLRLSQGMGRKNALAGLYWGGGKGVIASVNSRLSPDRRRALFEDYGSFITSLDGCYVTAEDVGVGNQDMMAIFSKTRWLPYRPGSSCRAHLVSRFTTCIPGQVGGSGNPSVATGTGVVCAVEAALDWRNRGDALAGKSVAIQGAGNVAQSVIANLLRRNVDYVKVTDISPDTLAIASAHAKRHDNGKSVVEFALSSRGDNSILSEDVDVVIPCALGGVLNQGTIPKIKAPIVCGAANNQLLDEETDAVSITEKGIVFVPDFIANRMGIVTCANEQYGYVSDDPAITRHFGRDWDNSIWKVSQSVLDRAKAERIPTAIAAKRIADELAAEPHPIWGHRCKQIVESLVARRWHRQHAANH